jgi:sialidase-1
LAFFFLPGAPARAEKAKPNLKATAMLTPEQKKRCLEILRKGVHQTEEFWKSVHAAEGLTLAGHAGEVKAVFAERLKTEKDGNRRIGLARELYRAGDKARGVVILELMNDPVADVRVHAAESLYKIGEIGDGKALKQAFAQPEPASLRMMAAGALAKAGDKDAMNFLRKSMSDPANRHYAAWFLGRIGDQTDLTSLRDLVKAETKVMERSFGEHALACLGDPAGKEALVKNLKSADAEVRALAAEHAGISGTAAAAKALLALLDDPVLDVRLRSAQALLVLDK